MPDNSLWFYSSLSLFKSAYNNVPTHWTGETYQITSCRRYFKMWQRI